jgi:peroxiredoxin
MDTTASHPVTPRPRTGLALACLILGVLAVFSSLFVVGGILGVVAVLCGAFHVVGRRGPNGMAWGGMALGLLSLALSAGMALLYVKGFEKFRAQVEQWSSPDSAGSATEQDWAGVQVPDLTLTSLEGETLRLSELQGRRLVLDFWATWCPPCRQEIPHFIQLAEENPREDLLIIGISSEDADTLKDFVSKQNVNYPIVSTNGLPEPFDRIEAIPTTFFIDRRGIIQEVIVGYHDYDSLKKHALATDTEGDPKPAPVPPSQSETEAADPME